MQFRDPRTPLSADQLALRRAVLEQVTRKPESLYMGNWARDDWSSAERREMGVCKTTRCIGGWAAELSPHTTLADALEDARGIGNIAASLLGLTKDEFDGPDDGHHAPLFYCDEEYATSRMREITERPHHEPR